MSAASRPSPGFRKVPKPDFAPSGSTPFVASVAYVAQTGSEPTWPEPLAKEACHGLAGAFVDMVSPHSEADEAGLLVQFLTAFGNTLGRGPHFIAEGDVHCPNLYAVQVGETSKGRKGSSWGRVRQVLEVADPYWVKERIVSGLSSGEGVIWQVRDPITKYEKKKGRGSKAAAGQYENVIVDPGVEDKRLLVVESEFATVLRRIEREANSLSPVLRDAWDRGNLRTLTKNSPAVATGALLSIIGHITKDEVRRYLSRTEAGNGFGNRFLWICTRRSKVLPEGGSLTPEMVSAFAPGLAEAIRLGRAAGLMERDSEARALWHEVYPALSEGKPGLLGAMIARAEAQVMRIALIYGLLDKSKVIRLVHLRAALAVWTYAEASARYIFGTSLGDPTADEILKSLRGTSEGLTRTQIRDVFGRHNSADVGRALLSLQEQGLARHVSEPTSGRPTERWYASATKATDATKAPSGGELRSLSSPSCNDLEAAR